MKDLVRQILEFNPELAERKAEHVAQMIRRWQERQTWGMEPRKQYELAVELVGTMNECRIPLQHIQLQVRGLVWLLFRKLEYVRFPTQGVTPKPAPVTEEEARSLMRIAGLDYHWFREQGISSYTCQGGVLEWACEIPDSSVLPRLLGVG